MSTELIEKVDGILKNAEMPDRHTFFQIEKFIIGKEPTAQAQLWAIVRELQARRETVEVFQKDLADAEDNLELLDLKIERVNRLIKTEAEKNEPFTDLNIQEHEINIRKLQREKESLVKSARKANKKLRAILEEMAYLAAGFEKIVSHIGEMRPIDDEQAQKEMWNEKLLEEFNLRVILQRPLDPEFIKTVMCLHDDAQVKKHVVALIGQIQEKMLADRKQAQKPQIEAKAKMSK
jgi:K+/H+ antiporter YhaU regulatory subunit KhtT